MSREERIVCDRCREEIKYVGWTAKLPFSPSRKRPFRFKLLKLFNGNPSGYDYSEREYELCQKCTMKLNVFLSGRELSDERN